MEGVEDPRIRPVALALIRRRNGILVERGRDEAKGETFFRLLGGTIEFGERGVEAIRRELREELSSEIDVHAHVSTIENLFTWEGRVGHEIILIFECTLSDATLYLVDEWEAHEETPGGGVTHEVAWKSIDSFGPGLERLYATGSTPACGRSTALSS
jgi:ADP-ribose pyrophosphatase YjhB (NUDIX family)